MALKPNQITRRNFVQRAGLLVASLGVAGGVQSGLMDNIIRKATKKWGGEALAAGSGTAPTFMVEILFRAGWQANSLFPSTGHTTAIAQRDPALNFYSSPANVLSYTAPGAARPVYFAKYAAGVGGDLLKTQLATINSASERIGVATSEVVNLQTGQHTGNFSSRAPNGNAPCPACLHAGLRAVDSPAAVQGIEWNNGVSTTNQRGMYNALAKVSDRTQFQSLYKDLPMYFSFNELKLIAGEISNGQVVSGKSGSIGALDALYMNTKALPGSADIAQVSIAGRGQAQLSLLTQLDAVYTAQLAGYTTKVQTQSMGGAQLAVALNSALSAFANGAATTLTVSLDSNDWHGDINPLDDMTGKQGMWNQFVGDSLAGFLKSAAAVGSPLIDPAKKIADSLLISLSSEFTRTPLRNGSGAGNDNGDGGNAAFVFIGSNVKSGSFGDIKGTDGSIQGFDPATGNNSSATISEMQVWKTAATLVGAPSSIVNMVSGTTLTALTK